MLFDQVDVDVVVGLLKANDLMHSGVDDFTEIPLHRNKSTIAVGEYGDKIMTTSKLGELVKIMFEKCLRLMGGDVRIKVECGKHTDEEGTWMLFLYQGFKSVLYQGGELIDGKCTTDVDL